ncbi:MAG: AI-2E family transporter [Anaerolineales bacterium]
MTSTESNEQGKSEPRFELPEISSPPWQTGTRLVMAVLMISVVTVLALRLQPILGPLIMALILAYLLHPLVTRLERRLKLSRSVAVLIIYLLVLVLIVGATTGVGFAVSQQIVGIVQDLTDLSRQLPDQIQQWSQQIIRLGPWSIDLAAANLAPLTNSLASAMQPLLSQTGTILASIVGATATTVGLLLLVMVMGYYLVKDFDRLDDALLELVPPAYRQDFIRLLDETGTVWHAFLRGQLILGLVMGVVTAALYGVIGLRFALALGLIAGLLEFVPIFGPVVAGGIAILVALFQTANWLGMSPLTYALVVAVIAILIQQIENNILVPRIIGHSLNLHPLIVLVAALAGGILAGVIGVLLAAPTVATLRLWGGYAYAKTVGLESWPSPITDEAEKTHSPGLLKRVRQKLGLRLTPKSSQTDEASSTGSADDG